MLIRAFYIVGITPGPIGNPIMYHPTINKIQVIDIIKKYGVIILNEFLNVYGLSFCKL